MIFKNTNYFGIKLFINLFKSVYYISHYLMDFKKHCQIFNFKLFSLALLCYGSFHRSEPWSARSSPNA